MARRHLRQACLLREFRKTFLVLRVLPGMDQHDGTCGDAFRASSSKCLTSNVFIERFDLAAVDTDTATDLCHLLVQHRRQRDGKIEQTWTRLVTDAQHIGKAEVHHQQRAFPFALEQRIGRNRGAHLHRIDRPGWDRLIERNTKHSLYAGNGGITIARGIFAEQLVGGESTGRVACNDVGECAASIDPELPFAGRHQITTSPLRQTFGLPRQFPKFRIAQFVRKRGGNHLEQTFALFGACSLGITDYTG